VTDLRALEKASKNVTSNWIGCGWEEYIVPQRSCVGVHIDLRVCICGGAFLCVDIIVPRSSCVGLRIDLRVFTCTCLYVRVCVCMCVYVCVCVCM